MRRTKRLNDEATRRRGTLHEVKPYQAEIGKEAYEHESSDAEK